MSSTGSAAVLVEPNKLETWEVPVADPEPGGVLAKVVLGGVCGSDVHLYTGSAGTLPFPVVLGHEGIARIEKLGLGVTTDFAGEPVAEGDLIFWSPTPFCGRCYACSVIGDPPCENSDFFEHAEKPGWGAFAEWAWLPASMAFYKLPEGADPEALAALGCALPTVMGGFEHAGGVEVGDTVLVQGAGPVGLSGVLLAAESGAETIIVMAGNERKLEIAKQLGATHVVSTKGTTAAERRELVQEILPRGPRFVFEAAGTIEAFPEGFDLVADHGTYLLQGLWGATGTVPIEPRLFTIKNVKVIGDSFHKNRDYYRAMKLAARVQDRVGLADLITDRFPVSETLGALRCVESGAAIKAVIDPSIGGSNG